MQCRDEERMWVEEHSPVSHSMLLILAVVVLVLGAIALALTSIDAAIDSPSTFPMYETGWSVGTMVFMLVDNAVYLPSVLFGLATLGLAQSETTRERAQKMARFLFIPGVVVVMVGIGKATCAVGSDYAGHDILTWSVAHEVLGHLGRSLFKAGTLAGLAYLCLRQISSADSCEANKLD